MPSLWHAELSTQKTGGQWVYVVDNSGRLPSRGTFTSAAKNPQTLRSVGGPGTGRAGHPPLRMTNFGDIDKLVLKKIVPGSPYDMPY